MLFPIYLCHSQHMGNIRCPSFCFKGKVDDERYPVLPRFCLISSVLNDKTVYFFTLTMEFSPNTNFRYMTFSACQEGFCAVFSA